jgi:hypothetical protein
MSGLLNEKRGKLEIIVDSHIFDQLVRIVCPPWQRQLGWLSGFILSPEYSECNTKIV